MKRETTIADNGSTERQKGKPEDTPAPEMSLLHAPIKKGWGEEEWIIWNKGRESYFKYVVIEDYHEDYQQLRAAIQWAAPDVVVLKISIKDILREFQLSKGGNDTW
jgi:hypothetical protein